MSVLLKTGGPTGMAGISVCIHIAQARSAHESSWRQHVHRLRLVCNILIVIIRSSDQAHWPRLFGLAPSRPEYAGTHQMYDRVQAARFPASETPSFELTFCCLPGC